MLMEEMKTYGVDAYNQSASEEQSKAMTNKATDSDHIPLVAEPILLESNQNHATITNDGVAPALPAAAEMGGGYVPMVTDKSQVFDARGNGDGEVSPTITGDHQDRITDYSAIAVEPEYVVRRLTPVECERLQGFPSERKVDVSQMTKDEYIAWNLAEGNIIVDAEKGDIYATRGPGGYLYAEPQLLKGTIMPNGYRVVSIRNGATKLQCRVHRVVWISKYGIIPDGYVVDHINNDKTDNRIANLQLLTPAENSHKAKEDGLYCEGLDHKATKLDPALKDEIAFLYATTDLTMRKLAELYGISKSRIGQIVKEVGWTDIGEWVDTKGKKHKPADAPRYKALGNSIAVGYANNCSGFWMWLMKRISAQYERDATLGSLFDGISGFHLAWARYNGVENCRWSSEIEEFCIAVCKKHFGDEETGEQGDYYEIVHRSPKLKGDT